MRYLCGKSVRRCAPHKWHTCLPSNHFVCCVKIKAHCAIGASFACHREKKTSPPFRSPPFKSARLKDSLGCFRITNLGGGAGSDIYRELWSLDTNRASVATMKGSRKEEKLEDGDDLSSLAHCKAPVRGACHESEHCQKFQEGGIGKGVFA